MDQYDAALHLLDRQVVGSDDRPVAKVDDVELTVEPDGTLVPTALLVGLPALLPRFGGRLGPWLLQRYVDLGTMQADRAEPSVIDLGLVASVSSEIRLSVPGADVVRRRVDQGVPSAMERWRLGALVGLPVRCERLPRRSCVLDVRLTG
ncbi:hypothetical protein E7Z54_22310, partial [Nocardioides sp.]